MAAFRQTAMLWAINPLRLWGAPPRLSPQRTFASGGPQGHLEHALRLKNKIGSAKAEELESCGDLIAQHCERTEEILDQVGERHGQVARAVRNVTFKCFFTGVVLGSIHHVIQSYYYKKAEFELEERRLEAERGLEVE